VDSHGKSGIADKPDVKPLTRPLFQFDPGWLFILAGLAVCAAGVLLPAQSDLEALQRQFHQLQSEENRAYARLKAHADFMDQVDRADPALVRRLAAAQLNMVPEGDTPVLLAASSSSPVTSWIENTIELDIRPPKPAPVSTLGRWANGPQRLWFFGAGIMSVFVGLILSPGPIRTSCTSNQSAQEASVFASTPTALQTSNSSDTCDFASGMSASDSAVEADDVESAAYDDVDASDDVLARGGQERGGQEQFGQEPMVEFDVAERPNGVEQDLIEPSNAASIIEVSQPEFEMGDIATAVAGGNEEMAGTASIDDHIDDLIAMIQDADTYQTGDESLSVLIATDDNDSSEAAAAYRVEREPAD
jgi:hypothetical protein